ncbi:MAG: hypothetical protein JXB13_15520 [Phycisphaerae bacterium]|nr:hypothetical protein [Phycisphaerae bacterium]
MKTPRKVYAHAGDVLLALCLVGLLHVNAAQAQQALVIDHTCTDVSQIPPCWIEAAKASGVSRTATHPTAVRSSRA